MKNNFKKKTKYKNKCMIFSPNGIIQEGMIFTGKEWENILVFEIGNSFDEMFEIVK